MLGCLWLGLGTLPLAAQEIRGVVRDSETGEGVSLAYVGLLEPGRELVAAALADSEGRFTLRAPVSGSYFFTVERIGYETVMDGLFELGDGGVVELQIGLKPTALAIDGLVVEVEGPARDLRVNGFYDRKAIGRGRFIEREDLDLVIDKVTDALRMIPRLTVRTAAPTITGFRGLLNPEVLVQRGTDICSPTLYVDGHAVVLGSISPGGPGVRPDDFVHPSEVEAMEVYTGPAETPPEFEATGGCGAVVIWTRIR